MSRANKFINEATKKINPDELLNLTYDLVRVKSPTLSEGEISRYYYDLLRNIGLDVYYQEVEGDRKNVIGILHGKGGGKNLLLGGHLDTIPPETCVEPRIEGNKIYGRGAEDMKGSLACMAIVARALMQVRVELKGDLILAAWVDHESPQGKGKGPRAVADMIRKGKLKVDSAVITEVSMLDTVGVVQGGMAYFTITVKGRDEGFHTTLVPFRSNPILWTGMVIEELYRMDRELDEKPWHPKIRQRPSIQIGIVNGGDFFNRLPEMCRLIGTIRWDPDEHFSVVKERLLDRLKRVEHRIWQSLDSSVKIDLDLELARDSYEVSDDEEIVNLAKQSIRAVVGDVKLFGSRIVADSSIFAKVASIPTIFYGPHLYGKVSSHSGNEWIDADRLEKVAKVLVNLTILYCGVE